MSQEERRERRARRAARVVLKLYEAHAPHVTRATTTMNATCRAGCSHCCMLPATATIPEMVAVVDELVGRADWAQRRPLLERAIEHHLREFAGVNVLSQAERIAFYGRQLPCVFLKDSRCEIYAVRPAVCRYHLVVSPPENCAIGATDDEVRIDLHVLEQQVALSGAREMGALYGGPIALCFVLAADHLGVSLTIDREFVKRCMVVRVPYPYTT
jgi:Fe-S-cluster containining protein